MYLTSMPFYFLARPKGPSGAIRKSARSARTTGRSLDRRDDAVATFDPDYVSPWCRASQVWVSQHGTTLTSDLSADAFANGNVGGELAAKAILQPVYTA
jgi:hypothetical protein